MAKGRKRKAGPRERNGRLARTAPLIDRGTERAQARTAMYGTDGTDPIGRAHYHGLLGPDADTLKSAARQMFRAYWPMFGVGALRSAIGGSGGPTPANDDNLPPEALQRKIERERWYMDKLAEVDALGRDYRRAFGQLVIDINPDEGPAWLDRAINAKRVFLDADRVDADTLAKALVGLRIIAGVKA